MNGLHDMPQGHLDIHLGHAVSHLLRDMLPAVQHRSLPGPIPKHQETESIQSINWYPFRGDSPSSPRLEGQAVHHIE